MKNTLKVGRACAIGAVICTIVALFMTPAFWWLGIPAGLAGGYIAYEFRSAILAIPVAFRAACKDWRNTMESVDKKMMNFFAEPHPFYYSGAVLSAPFFLLAGYWFFTRVAPELFATGPFWLSAIVVAIVATAAPLLFVELTWVAMAPFGIFALIGARRGEKCYWNSADDLKNTEICKRRIQDLQKEGYVEKPCTYKNAFRWMALGVKIIVIFFVWTLWKYLGIVIGNMFYFIGRFFWHLFKLVHLNERVLCAIDGTIGGVMSYRWLFDPSMSSGQMAVLVVFGALLGAVIGVADYNYFSVKWLKLVPAKAK